MSDIAAWLENLGLSKYAGVFTEHEIEYDVLSELAEAHLEAMGLPLGPRLKLLKAIAALEADKSNPTQAEPSGEAPVAPAANSSQAERRQLTVMFIDLVGSTALSERLDPEDLSEIIHRYQDCCAGIVGRFGGYTAKFMGDGILVYFGYPQAHEDDAERAIRAGLDIVQAVSKLKIIRDTPLQVRIGVATGLVVVGEIIGIDSAQELAVVGETPNLAARLQALAEPDALVVAPSTQQLVGGLFEYADLGCHRLKGFTEPVQAWQVMGEAALESRFEATRRGRTLTALIGREEELDLLRRRWQRAREGEGQVVLLSGEPGIGKSRLIQALHDSLRDEPHTQLRYFCAPYYQSSTLYPVIDQLERASGFFRDDSTERKLDKLEQLLTRSGERLDESMPLLAALLSLTDGDRYSSPALDPQRQKNQTLEALISQVVGLARQQPLLVLFEDLHWIDPTSLELLGLLVERLVGLPVFLLLSSRPGFSAAWTDQAQVSVLNLNRLNARRAAQIAQKVGGGKPLPKEVLNEIVAKTDGVPLFIEELTKTVLESGLLRETAGRYELSGPLPALAVPSTLQDSLMERLDRLSAPVKDLAQTGAVIGRQFSFELLSRLTGLDDDALERRLIRLSEAELLYCRGAPPGATYTFKHALVQDAAYQSLLKTRRQQLHTQLAQVLERQFSDQVASEPELLAEHYTRAGLDIQAIDYWHKAGQQAYLRSAYAEAITHLERGLELLAALPANHERDRQALEMESARASALAAYRGYLVPVTAEAYERARALCRDLGDPPAVFPLLRGICTYRFLLGNHEAALSTAHECLRLAQNQSDTAPLSLAHRLVGMCTWTSGQFVTAREHIENAIAYYDPGQHQTSTLMYGVDLKVVALFYLMPTLCLLGYPDRALATATEAIKHAGQLQYAINSVHASHFLSLLHELRREYSAAHEEANRQLSKAQECGLPDWAEAAMLKCHFTKSISQEASSEIRLSQFIRAVSESRSKNVLIRLTMLPCRLVEMLISVGLTETAKEVIADALTVTEQTSQRWNESELIRLEGEMLLTHRRSNSIDMAETCFQQALAVAREQEAKWWELRTATSLAKLWRGQGKGKKARELLTPVYNWFTEGFDTADLKDAKALLDELA